MPYNPLPDSFDVSVRRADEAESIARRIQELEGVEDIVYGREMVRNLVGALRVMWAATGAIAVVVLVGASMVVANTIKLSVLAHNREIETMRLVGASDAFILFPFVVEGLLIGVIGAAVASLMVFAAYSLLIRWMGFRRALPEACGGPRLACLGRLEPRWLRRSWRRPFRHHHLSKAAPSG